MKQLLFFTAILVSLNGWTQDLKNAEDLEPPKEYDNIHVQKLNTAKEATSFVIWVAKSVKLHKHVFHTENIYVLGGKGEMIVGDQKFVIKKGDYFQIPKDTPHGLTVLSKKPMKVISVQSPEFHGKDRVFLKN